MKTENLETYFAFLDSIREDGKINMFGAAPVLAEVYDLSKTEARKVLLEWMDTFAQHHGMTS